MTAEAAAEAAERRSTSRSATRSRSAATSRTSARLEIRRRSSRSSEINKAIDEAGVDHTVNLVTEDNCGGADQQCAVQAARKMVESDNASCIAGAWASADTIPTAESVAIPDEVLLISPASTSDEITGLEDDGLVNRTAPPDSFQGPTLSTYLVEKASEAPGQDGQHRRPQRRLRDRAGRDVQRRLGGRRAARSARTSSTTRSCRTTTPRRSRSSSGNPDGIVIIDFPETFDKVGPALVRTGTSTRRRRSSPTA